MFGRPVHLLAAAAVAAAASLFSISDASAGCCGGGYYQAPVAYYTAPVVYSYSYAAPVAYASGCGCGGYASSYGYGYAARPMYVVNQGPAYTHPVVNAEPTPAYDEGYGYRRAPRYYGDGGYRIRRHWGYRHGYGHRFGYGTPLSRAVRGALPAFRAAIESELERLAAEPILRDGAGPSAGPDR